MTSDTTQLLVDAAERILRDNCDKALWDAAETGEYPQSLARLLQENGFTALALPDSGAHPGDLYHVMKLAGRFALPVPLAEAAIANQVIGNPDRVRSLGLIDDAGVARVPWSNAVDESLLVHADGSVTVVAGAGERECNLAGESRDVLRDDGPSSTRTALPVRELLCLARSAQMSGALTRVLELTLTYAGERAQFGRPIAKFQAIQHTLAVMASEVAAAGRAVDSAIDALAGARFTEELAVAKARVGEAAGVVAEAAHQVHGAMGFTHEHQLHHFTRRLWAWRDELGNERHWQIELGRRLCAAGADELWNFVATRG